MLGIFRRLALGLILIAAVSALLLLSDLRSRMKPAAAEPSPSTAPARKMRVALLQHASQAILDLGRDGMLAGLAEQGWREGDNLDFKRYNAEGDMPVAQNIAKEMAGGGYDLLMTISTPSLQAVANANKAGKTPHVFGLVTDPYAAGVGINRENHLDHPAHLAGYGTMQPVALAFQTAREMNPSLSKVGVVYNTGETNSEVQVKLARKVCADMGITLLESSIENSSGVGEAAAALVARGVDAIWVGGDVTVLTAIDALVAAAQKGRIPVFTVVPSNIKRGVLFDLGANYFEVGRIVGELAGEILNGRSPSGVSIENRMPETLTLNLQVPAGLRDRWVVSDKLVQRAAAYIDAQGVTHDKTPPRASALPPPPANGSVRRLAVAYYAPEPSWEDCFHGLVDELRTLGYEQGKNLSIKSANTQGEASNILPILQNYDSSDAEALVTFSTPMLQGALSTIRNKPVVFTYCTDPIAAGAGRSWTDHDPRVTGVGTMVPVPEAVAMIRRVLPNVKRLGTLFNAGEVNSTRIVDLLRVACREAGIELVEVSVATTSEAMQAAQALIARHAEAIYLPSDNLVYQAYAGVMQTFDRARLPVVNGDPAYIGRGVFASVGPGYYAAGQAAARKLARVFAGEKPASIPMENVSANRVAFDRAVAARLGLQLDETVLQELETKTAAAIPAKPASPNPSGKKWKIAIVLYNETPPAEETLAGMKDAWARSPLVAGRDYEIKIRSSQGDMASLGGIIDAALTDGADIVVPISTPTLQLAVQKVKRSPIVFSMVANPMAAGAGKSYTDHLPNVTGIAVLAPFEEVLDLLEKYYPAYKRLGTVFCPNETNSVDLKQSLEASCKRRGFTLESVAANTATDLPDAALALMTRPIDAVLQISDNLTSGGFTAITRAARQAQKPLFSLNSTTVPLGAPFALGRDYHNSGEATVTLIERVIGGEDPGKIPFQLPPKISKTISLANAAAVGMKIPPEFVSEIEAFKKADAPVPAAPTAR